MALYSIEYIGDQENPPVVMALVVAPHALAALKKLHGGKLSAEDYRVTRESVTTPSRVLLSSSEW